MNEGVNEVKYVGVDVGKRKCRAAVVDEDGVLIKEFSFTNDFFRHRKGCFRAFHLRKGCYGVHWKPLG